MASPPQIQEPLAFGLTRLSILEALRDNWLGSNERLYPDSIEVPDSYLGVYDASRLDAVTEQGEMLCVVYPQSGVYRSTSRSTGPPAYGHIKRSADWVIDVRFFDPNLDPVTFMTIENAGYESQLVAKSERMNAIVIDVIRRQLGNDNLTMVPGLLLENIYLTAALTMHGVILSSRTIWSFTQETESPYNNNISE